MRCGNANGDRVASPSAKVSMRAVSCGARHVSVYPLSIELGTPMAASVEAGRFDAPDPDTAADMMLAAEVALASAGLMAGGTSGSPASCSRVNWSNGLFAFSERMT